MNIKYNVVGTKSGKTIIAKMSLSYGNARAVKVDWEQRGCSMIVNEQRQQVHLDQVELYPVDVIWSGAVVEEAKVGA